MAATYTTVLEVVVICAATSLETINIVENRIYNLAAPAMEIFAPTYTALPVICATGKKINVTPLPPTLAALPAGFTFSGQVLSVYSTDPLMTGTVTQLEWTATVEQTLPPTSTGTAPPPVQMRQPFKVTTQCVVQSILIQPIPATNYDIGVGGAITANLPPVTVTPAACKPFVQLQWTRESA